MAERLASESGMTCQASWSLRGWPHFSSTTHIEPQIFFADSAPRLPEHSSVRGRSAREACEIGPAGETKHRASPVTRDRLDSLHHVAHACRVRRHEEDAESEVLVAELIVDRP
jgi:hypothetical protein